MTMASDTHLDGRDLSAVEDFLRSVTAPDYTGPAPDPDAVAVVLSVIAQQRSVAGKTSALGLSEPAAEYLASCVDAVLPGEGAESGVDSSPLSVTVRLGVEFMEANLREAIDISDVADAGNVSVRAMQLAFRRELDTTPMAYLRDLRMRAAHGELSERVIGDGTTVTSVAIGWGFAHPGRFAIAYRHVYGRSPHLTLAE
ncbi:helix-turn-helix transcriptional regulator [Nocardia jejuensis]|uniref:helix-turn-helix transcriptional regulator n=1 Tax=Nocardia jejuensis TaxID=328049 RepID=UPI000A591792|nr:helix-turn-helix transcriptional regulator [Nocardia jejuensis]